MSKQYISKLVKQGYFKRVYIMKCSAVEFGSSSTLPFFIQMICNNQRQ